MNADYDLNSTSFSAFSPFT